MKKTLNETLRTYRSILRWNGESVTELMDAVRRLMQNTPLVLLQPLPIVLHSFRYNRGMRFDFSRINEPVLAVDKKGFALVGSLRSMKIMELLRI